MASRIEQIVEEIEEYISNCKHSRLSSSTILVNKDEIDVLLADLREKAPEEIRQYKKIISNEQNIIKNAKQKADEIVRQAAVQTNQLVSEHEIMQQAYMQANEIVRIATVQAQDILDSATEDANNIRSSAISYTDDMLGNLERIIQHSMNTANNNFKSLIKGLTESDEIVKMNRSQLAQSQAEPSVEEDEKTDDKNGKAKSDKQTELKTM
ncbi:hypothetical protein SAMN05216249_101228 [Acetitomaculum ruminis DSM 5522]|uniref:ATPase n=1 Tax=Acetitomaculum ruminis DSM 5522 TaxID=1120918 RepID=A0A1I0V9D8_9FIRM|nr:ATPase [Acetitomaculum ruminis]SFA72862.1 hypothetical protein SAMN05216249_101228 [Acetitomaculum ruminis DSM 5522]